MRLKSTDAQTRKTASRSSTFQAIRQEDSVRYLAIPRVSSERRNYIPIAFLKDTIAGDKLQLVANATNYHFGILTSSMHMTWMKTTSGRFESRYQYSAKLTFNTFTWPENPTSKQKANVENAAQSVLDARAKFPNASLADLYDPNTMPLVLVKAHQALDKAVDLCYRPQPFTNETKRIEFLFELYDKYTSGMFPTEKKSKKKKEAASEIKE